MAQTTFTQAADPAINVIEQELPRSSGGPALSDDRQGTLDSAAMDAVSARRWREFDAARARLRDQAMRDDPGTSRQAGAHAATDAAGEADRGRVPIDQPPERVRKRYLRAGNQYFQKDAPYQLAFEDMGPYLVTEHNRPDVVESMIDMANAKSWRRIRVSGHEEFRSEVWLQATLLGIEVSGYEPKAADLARLADARQARLNNRIEVAADAGATAAAGTVGRTDARPAPAAAPSVNASATVNGASPPAPGHDAVSEPRSPAASRNAANDEPEAPRRYVGELREHGSAPYLHNPARSDSYYVVFRDPSGIDQAVWGVDLGRALRESDAGIGLQVVLENLGKRLVTVRVPVLDGDGRVIGDEEKDVYRNTWQAEVVQRDRTASLSPPQPASPVHGEPRRRGSQRPESEQTLHLAALTAAMREQGFSERSIARVQQHAARMLVAFEKEGIPLPTPKVFDPKAPSGRDRRDRKTRPAPERESAREIDRTPAEPSPMSPSR